MTLHLDSNLQRCVFGVSIDEHGCDTCGGVHYYAILYFLIFALVFVSEEHGRS